MFFYIYDLLCGWFDLRYNYFCYFFEFLFLLSFSFLILFSLSTVATKKRFLYAITKYYKRDFLLGVNENGNSQLLVILFVYLAIKKKKGSLSFSISSLYIYYSFLFKWYDLSTSPPDLMVFRFCPHLSLCERKQAFRKEQM